ncbi:tetraspanin [Coprinopsis cinerea okayama7|uniref:Tetraspanin n=1 Tax=Coprinopsis cinerea (strain Okayama-7 / 130 / ATCC MYA-4618 / FGSC 9003) TaxID=240176 RepID=A8NG11_COPC7|nr:tetraspanin [Coprinopsis cinerea okayama7\|eukprot:XP_001833448.1 tetraspanin [Coprinopsis cinerea okayama7\
MVSRKLMAAYAFFDVCLLAAGIVALVLSITWRAPDVLMNMVLSNSELTAGTILGVSLLVTFVISVAAVVQRSHVTLGFVILNWALLLDALGIVVIGTFVWYWTLQPRANFRVLWEAASPATRIILQDRLKCCGYFNGTDLAEIGGSFCTSREVIDALPVDPEFMTNFCVTPITAFADSTLNNIFTTVYGYMAIVICLFLTSLCVIKKRQEDERFKRIDAKRGGRGFV